MNPGTLKFSGAILAAITVGTLIWLLVPRPKHLDPCPAPLPADHAKYVLYFGDCGPDADQNRRVSVVSTGMFETALHLQKVNFISLTKKEHDNDQPTTISAPTISSNAKVISVIYVAQQRAGGAVCTHHVTQKVGMDTPEQVQAVLATLKPE